MDQWRVDGFTKSQHYMQQYVQQKLEINIHFIVIVQYTKVMPIISNASPFLQLQTY